MPSSGVSGRKRFSFWPEAVLKHLHPFFWSVLFSWHLFLDWLPSDAAWQMDRRVSDLWPLSGIADTQSPWKHSGWPCPTLAFPFLIGLYLMQFDHMTPFAWTREAKYQIQDSLWAKMLAVKIDDYRLWICFDQSGSWSKFGSKTSDSFDCRCSCECLLTLLPPFPLIFSPCEHLECQHECSSSAH